VPFHEPVATLAVARFRSTARSGAALALGSMSCVQLGLAASIQLFDRVGPAGAAWLRLAWAAVLLLLLGRPRPSHFSRAGLLACLALGVVTAGLTLFFMAAVARLPLGTASALEFLGPLGVAMARGGRGRLRWPALAGAGVVLLTEPWHGGADPVGVVLALAAAACWAAYILLTQRVGDEVAGLRGLAVSMSVAAAVATVAVGPSVVGHLGVDVLVLGLGLAVLLPVVPFSLELLALRRLTSAAFGTLMSLEPAIALLVGLVALRQVPGWAPLAGVGFVVVAGAGAARTGGRRRAVTGSDVMGSSSALSGPARRPAGSSGCRDPLVGDSRWSGLRWCGSSVVGKVRFTQRERCGPFPR
jgi:inner membrane transporter RhtA